MLSAVVLTRNNADTITGTIGALSKCDEILIIDDQSTDKTAEIAHKLGARVFVRALGSDFAAQRNYGLNQAKHDWVLFVDSDEIVSESLMKEIISVIETNQEVNGYMFKRQDAMWGSVLRFGETSDVRLLRLAKKDAGVFIRPVHEVWEVQGPVHVLREPLHHIPHQDVAQFLTDINRYTTIAADFLFQNKVSVSGLGIIAYPAAKFIRNYFLKLGFLDGIPGIVVAVMMSMHSFLTRAKLWTRYHPHRSNRMVRMTP